MRDELSVALLFVVVFLGGLLAITLGQQHAACVDYLQYSKLAHVHIYAVDDLCK